MGNEQERNPAVKGRMEGIVMQAGAEPHDWSRTFHVDTVAGFVNGLWALHHDRFENFLADGGRDASPGDTVLYEVNTPLKVRFELRKLGPNEYEVRGAHFGTPAGVNICVGLNPDAPSHQGGPNLTTGYTTTIGTPYTTTGTPYTTTGTPYTTTGTPYTTTGTPYTTTGTPYTTTGTPYTTTGTPYTTTGTPYTTTGTPYTTTGTPYTTTGTPYTTTTGTPYTTTTGTPYTTTTGTPYTTTGTPYTTTGTPYTTTGTPYTTTGTPYTTTGTPYTTTGTPYTTTGTPYTTTTGTPTTGTPTTAGQGTATPRPWRDQFYATGGQEAVDLAKELRDADSLKGDVLKGEELAAVREKLNRLSGLLSSYKL
ncbi:hypothetical protein WME75_26345 [Sorangium sp. So ce1014]|uniref:hypothetical protein n=1 Tax=Sorangium sp. So ce1014 TaxID=3133326 RepID=UPI003F61ACCC